MAQAKFYYHDENAPKPTQPNHIGVNALIELNGKLLLEHRADSDCWSLVGGGLQMEETLTQGLTREIKEETGMDIHEEQLSFYRIYDDPSRIAQYPDGNVLRIISVVYRLPLCRNTDLKCSSESRELKYFAPEEIRRLTIAKTHLPILQDYLEQYNSASGTI